METKQEKVLFSHDGGVDDYLALMLLLTMKQVEVLGVIVTPADCYIQPASSATRKIIDLMGRSDIPVAESTVRGINPFPHAWRASAFHIDHFPILNRQETIHTPLLTETGQDFMARILRQADEPLTILETGPLTTIAEVLQAEPELEAKIGRILWMGGAVDVPGNISFYIDGSQDGTAEWNVYWDPLAAHQIWETEIPIVMCPLDITNTVRITSEFVRELGRRSHHPVSELAGYCYSLVAHQDYYAWDLLTAAFLERPDLFKTREVETVIVTEGPSQGRTMPQQNGRKILMMDKINPQEFFDYVLEQFAR